MIRCRKFSDSFHDIREELCRGANCVVQDVDLARVLQVPLESGGLVLDDVRNSG
jgi:hypothetical protein